MSIHIAHHRKNNAYNAFNVSSTVQKNVFSVRRKQSICMSSSRKLFWNKFHIDGLQWWFSKTHVLVTTSRFGAWIDAVILPRFSWFLQMSAVIFAILPWFSIVRKYRYNVWYGKKLLDGKNEDIIIPFEWHTVNVTDSKRDRQTPHDGIGRAYA